MKSIVTIYKWGEAWRFAVINGVRMAISDTGRRIPAKEFFAQDRDLIDDAHALRVLK